IVSRRTEHRRASDEFARINSRVISWIRLALGSGDVASCLHELRELRVGDRRAIGPESVDADKMHRLGVRHVAVVAAHPEGSSWNPPHAPRPRPGRWRAINADNLC